MAILYREKPNTGETVIKFKAMGKYCEIILSCFRLGNKHKEEIYKRRIRIEKLKKKNNEKKDEKKNDTGQKS
jgi:hypothetical protein